MARGHPLPTAEDATHTLRQLVQADRRNSPPGDTPCTACSRGHPLLPRPGNRRAHCRSSTAGRYDSLVLMGAETSKETALVMPFRPSFCNKAGRGKDPFVFFVRGLQGYTLEDKKQNTCSALAQLQPWTITYS